MYALDGIEAQYAEHTCQGIWTCSHFDQELLDGCERYEPDEEQAAKLWEAKSHLLEEETESVEIQVARHVNHLHLRSHLQILQRGSDSFVSIDSSRCRTL